MKNKLPSPKISNAEKETKVSFNKKKKYDCDNNGHYRSDKFNTYILVLEEFQTLALDSVTLVCKVKI